MLCLTVLSNNLLNRDSKLMKTEDGSFGNILHRSTTTANLKMYNEMHITFFKFHSHTTSAPQAVEVILRSLIVWTFARKEI